MQTIRQQKQRELKLYCIVVEAPTEGDPREDRGDAGWTQVKQFHMNQYLYDRDIKQRLTNAWGRYMIVVDKTTEML